MYTDWIILAILLTLIMVLSVLKRKLTLPAALLGGGIGIAVFMGAGFKGVLLLGAFFILGIAATSWKKEQKRGLVPGEQYAQQRRAGQVFANGGVAAIMGLLAFLDIAHSTVYRLMMAASLASATADTLSSELGMVYGKRFYNILSGKKEARGLDGVISAEGTAIGAAGALLIALLYVLPGNEIAELCVVTLAGIAGNLADSVAGALWERKKLMGNNAVNFLNTLLAALVALVLWKVQH